MHDIVHELTIHAAPARVYEAVATPAGLATWWTTDVTISSGDETTGEGTEVVLGFEASDAAIRLRVDTLDPPVLAHLTCLDGPEEWPSTQIAFRIEPEGDGDASVRFWHGGWEYEDGALPRCSFQWAMDLDRLRQTLEA